MLRRVLIAIVLAVSTIPLPPMALAGDAACGLPGAPTATVYLPNITKTLGGPAGWVTPFIVQNVGTVPTTLEVSFYDFATGALVTCMTASGLAPQTSFSHIPNVNADLPHGSAFSVVVRSFGSDVVAVVNEHQGEGARQEALSYVGLSSGATTVGLPWVARQDGGWLTTFIVQNLGTAQATATAAFANEDGTRTATLSRTIEPGRSWAVNPANEPSLLDGTSYAVVLTSDQLVGVVANAHNDAPTAAQPMAFSYNGVPLQTGDANVPWVGRNAEGRTTTVVVQNLGAVSAAPQLTLRRIGAAGQVTIPLAQIPPGRSLRYQLPTTASCPPAGAENCPAEGEHSLTVSGGSLAVLAYALGGGSVMGGTGTTASSSRVYLPNITHTLGGAAGWTTPIVIQSVGATTAMLRWYRFADGQLAITQYVGGLLPGASVKVDPRSVAELADNTQYGVVVDGNGPLRASVLELSSSGGDGAMAYEGFGAATVVGAAPVVTSLRFDPGTLSVAAGESEDLGLVASDQSGAGVVGVPVVWTVEPSTLGTVDGEGRFTASTQTGAGTATAMFGGLRAAKAVSTYARTTTQGGLTFTVQASSSADVYIEQTISTADAQTIFAVVEGDVRGLQTEYGQAFARRPQVYAFATTTSYQTGLQTIVGMPADRAAAVAGNSGGVFSAYSPEKVSVNWSELDGSLPVTAVRHELVHMLLHQLAQPTIAKDIPAWFNEGNAELAEQGAARNMWYVNIARYTAASMATNDVAFTVAEITDQAVWNERTGLAQSAQYYQAGEIVRALRETVGTFGVTRILQLMRDGKQFNDAFAEVMGMSVGAFEPIALARLNAVAPTYPGVAAAQDDRTGGPGPSYTVYGLPPNATFTLDIRGEALRYYNSDRVKTANAYGVYSSYLSAAWPVDTYIITMTYGGTTISVTVAKASSSIFEVRLVA